MAARGASDDELGETDPVGGRAGESWELYVPRLVADAQNAPQSGRRREFDVDGRLDCATTRAVERCEWEHGFRAPGITSPATLSVLQEKAGATSYIPTSPGR